METGYLRLLKAILCFALFLSAWTTALGKEATPQPLEPHQIVQLLQQISPKDPAEKVLAQALQILGKTPYSGLSSGPTRDSRVHRFYRLNDLTVGVFDKDYGFLEATIVNMTLYDGKLGSIWLQVLGKPNQILFPGS